MNRAPVPALALVGLSLWLVPPPVAARGADGPKVWSVVVGIDRYEDALVPRSEGAMRDARAISGWLSDTAGWGESSVLRLNDPGKRAPGPAQARSPDLRPTRANLDWAFDQWLPARVGPDDLVVFYFAGQAGARGPKPGASAGRAYLLPIDARAVDLDATGWSPEDALDRSGLAKKARVVIWLDTSLRGRGGRPQPPEPGAPDSSSWLESLVRWPGVTAWLAADGVPEPEDGAFAAAIRRGMGTTDRAHNLLGCLGSLRGDKALSERGFRAAGGIGPAASLWPGSARVVEKAAPELVLQAGHGDRVTAVLVAADNAHAITASEDSTVRVWKFGDGEPSMVRVLSDPFIGVKALTLDPEGRLLLAGDGAGGITGWDMAGDRPRLINAPGAHTESIAALAFLPEGLLFVSLDVSCRSILWDGSGMVLRNRGAFSDEPITRLVAAPRPAPGAPALVAAVEGAGGKGGLRAFDAKGAPMGQFDGPGGAITALDLSVDGRTLVVGDDGGRVAAYSLPGQAVTFRQSYRGSVGTVRISRVGLVAVADGKSLRLVELKEGGADFTLAGTDGRPSPGRVERAEFSVDGRWLAACTPAEGRVMLWKLGDPARPAPVAIPPHDAPGLTPAFSPDGRALVVGDQDGGIRAWGLQDGPEGPAARPRIGIKPARGRVASLAPSPSGKFLLEITKDGLALVWDLEQGRGCRPLADQWAAGSFLADENRLLMLRKADQGAFTPVLFDREKNAEVPGGFVRPPGPDGQPSNAAFGKMALSKSGRWVVAGSIEGQPPLACVWEVATGKIVHTARVHDGGLTAVDFSADEAFFLTASDDGTARLWKMDEPGVEIRRAAATFFTRDNVEPALTAARVSPRDHRRVATGSRGGLVIVWDWEKARGRTERVREPIKLNGEVNALAFSPDGRWLAASAMNEKVVRFIDLDAAGGPKVASFQPRTHHAEQVGALAAWPGGSMIVSGGDDAAVRFWDLKDRSLVGTLLAEARNLATVDWLAYTPEGLFDGSMPGEAMLKWRVGDRLLTLQQTEDTHYTFGLAGSIARGEKLALAPPKPIQADGPGLRLSGPPPGRPSTDREVEIRLWSDVPRPASLRLYQNGVPVRSADDFEPGEGPNLVRTRVTLRKGENRLYAMASRADSADGRSDDIVLRYEGDEPAGKLHTLALGISAYRNRALKYANTDAERISEFLRQQGVRGVKEVGERIVLLDDKVNEDAINDAFRRLSAKLKGHPEDTVVLFLAGHTDTDDAANQFCLLLQRFPFAADPLPIGNVAARGVVPRGNAPGAAVRARVGDPNVLPYSLLHRRLAGLEALQRLVIVDACQAGAILDDQAVAKIQKYVEKGSRKARNSYLLAARRGEPANEVDALRHGLLTYTLLKGMGADGLTPLPDGVGPFPGPPSADLDSNGFVSSDELVAYADDTLPQLARMFPDVVTRAGGAPLPPADQARRKLDLDQKLRLQSDGGAFPLTVHPGGPKATAVRP